MVLLAGLLLGACPRCRADSVDITLPAAMTFVVSDLGASTGATQNPTTINYSNLVGSNLRIGIRADAANFTRPAEAGGYIQASLVSWTSSGCGAGGTAYDGYLQQGSYTTVYEGTAASNSFDMTWTLGIITQAVRAGDHTLTATWKLESF